MTLLTLSRRSKSMDWFLYDNGLRFERVKTKKKNKENENKRSRISIPKIRATDNVIQAKVDMAKEEVKKESAKRQKHQNVPEKVRKEVGKYALIHEKKAAVDKYSKIYPKYDLKRTSLNKWKTKCKGNKENTLIKKSARPNLLSDELLQKTKDIIIGTCSAGTVRSRRMVITIGTGTSLFLASFRAYIFHYFLFRASLFYFNFRLNPGGRREHLTSHLS